MKIAVIMGSPHKKGSSNMLAGEFIRGAQENGHIVNAVDAAHMKINPCLGCNHCKANNGKCVHNDDNAVVMNTVLDSDMIVFVTPIYYMGMSAQLKTVIDRFYSYNDALIEKPMKAVLITASADSSDEVMMCIAAHYKALCGYLKLDDCGSVFGKGCYAPSATAESEYMQKAYELGKSIL